MDKVFSIEHFELLVTLITGFLASSGFWLFMSKKADKNSQANELLLGLAHDRIMYLGMKYINRGSITKDEYENLRDYLFNPYEKMGGNGTAKRVMSEVDKLPILENSKLSNLGDD